ncbi:MAG: hypothetical protein BGO90_14075 [Legionella sp. 40-6]|nr:PQQ-like beta-propeller repeat protein [Legionella sp.]OJY15373.1 MAG: hypothetical protein BGO90_14075 [Legionella sp. 40-6]
MRKNTRECVLYCCFILCGFFLFLNGHAAQPLWTFTPDPNTPTTLSMTPLSEAIIQYTVTNQSRKTHTLTMQPITGITQISAPGQCAPQFTLNYKQSCNLLLSIKGGQLARDIRGGPVVCDFGNLLQCYQPSAANALNITRIPMAKYVITPLAAPQGIISPNTPQIVYAGGSVTFKATPNSGFQVDQWFMDGGVAQKGGATFTLSHIENNHTVEVTFTRSGTIYAGTNNGAIFFSTDNGLSWTPTATPALGYGINSLFAAVDTLYAGSVDGKVYYSTNNGVTWSATASLSGGVAVNAIFVTGQNSARRIYAGTADGNLYSSNDGTLWNSISPPGVGAINGLYITPEQVIYVGSADGNIYYSLNDGGSWNQITGPEASASVPIQNIFIADGKLYVNTRRVSSNSTLPPGTVDFEYAYTSTGLTTPNPQWTLYSQITYTFFVNSNASFIIAGTQDGFVYSLTTGDALGFITYNPITSLFFLG